MRNESIYVTGRRKLIFCLALISFLLPSTAFGAEEVYGDFACSFVDIRYDFEEGAIYFTTVTRDGGGGLPYFWDAMDRGILYYYDAAGNRKLLFDLVYQPDLTWTFETGPNVVFVEELYDANEKDTRLRFKWTSILPDLLGKIIYFQFRVDWDLDNNDTHNGTFDGDCAYSVEVTTIDPINNLQASSLENNCAGIQLTWNNPDTRGVSYDQLRHFVFRNGVNITPGLSGLDGSSTSFTDETAIPGVIHSYQIRSYLYTGSTFHPVFSRIAEARTYAIPPAPILQLEEDGCSQQVKVSWAITSTTDLDKYVLERSTSSDFSNAQISEFPANSNLFLDNAQNGVQYYYRISALNACGEGGSSGSSTGNIKPNFTLDDIVITRALPISRGRIYVDWARLDCYNPQEVVLEKRNQTTGIVESITLENFAVQYIDEDVNLCVNYRYKLIVKRQDNSVYISEPVQVFVREDISDVLVDFSASEGYYPDRVSLTWEANKENLIENYKIYRRPYSEEGSDFKLIANIKNGALNWVDQNIEANQYYEYKLMAFATCVEMELSSNELRAIGFRQPRGIISGQISYEGGTAVPDVKVLVNSSETGISQGTCLDLDGKSLIKTDLIANTDFSQGFTIEGWVNMDNYRSFRDVNDQYSYFFLPSESFIFSYFEDGIFSDNPDQERELWFIVGEEGQRRELIYDLLTDPKNLWNEDDWNHISYNYNRDSVKLFLNGKVAVSTSSVPLNNIVFDYTFGNNLDGKMDEIRVWNRSLGDEETARLYRTVTSGKEDGLILNLHLDEGYGEFVFDNSQNDNGFNGNHGKIVHSEENDPITFEPISSENSRFSTDILPSELLSRHAYTDDVGSYFISGIPYRGEGEIYRVTPVFGQHSFDPPAKTRFIGDGEFVHNDVDFIDVSSFLVTGRVTYRDTDFPVEDAFIKVDGKVVAGRDNLPIKTNNSGEFSVSVPIGDHYVSVEKEGHIFNESVFPGVDSLGLPLLFDFQEPITGMQFYDDTKVKLVGRLVGGTLEGDKKIGFGFSKNNIGPVQVRLVPIKPFSLNEGTTENNFIEFSNDAQTGEYSTYIIPEEFGVEAISHDNYSFDSPAFKAKVDLRKALDPQTEIDSVYQEILVNGEFETRFDSVRFFEYNLRRDWIYRSEPSISVNSNGQDWLSDEVFTYQKREVTEEIQLRTENDGHLFPYPVFTQLHRYPWQLWVFEEYIHSETNETSTVNVTDATITVSNNLAEPNEPIKLATDTNGKANYTFTGGFPNTAYDENTPENSFTLTANIVARTSSGQVANWPGTNEVYRAYVLGSYPTGNNFVTTGPEKVDYILRDPPGSASYAFMEKGTTTSTTTTFSMSDGTSGTKVALVKAGLDIETESGTPFFSVVTKVEAESNIGVTLEHSNISTDENTVTSTTTFTENFSTSSSGDFVGAPGDVFIGRSTNIVYGLANNLGIAYPEDIPDDGIRLESEFNGLTIGIQKSVRLNPSFNTFFIFSQKQIEENVISSLKLLRNLLFVNQPDRYKLIFNDSSDEKYASNNDDPLWGNDAASAAQLYNGPSYEFIPFDYTSPDWTQDSVRFYNNQIKNWIEILADNERQKLRAKPNNTHSNISFDAGTKYEGQVETSTETEITKTYEVILNPGISEEAGFALNGVGANLALTETFVHNETNVNGETNILSQTVGFVLEDQDENNFLSVDVLDDREGNGPIFRTKGGQTTCPYEGETKTKYYNRGTILDQATVRLENPVITADAAVIQGVPEDEAAIFKLNISNATEAEVNRWFLLRLNSASNPDGAQLFIDGAPLSSFGLTIYIPAGRVITKTLEIRKGAPNVNDYTGIELQVIPICEVDDIVSTVELGVSFVPACSKVVVDIPQDNWIANVYTRDTQEVRLSGFNVNLSSFKSISLQYKDQSSSNWITLNTYYKSQQDYDDDNSDAKEIIGSRTSLSYKWILKDLVDRAYEIRALTSCTDGSIYESEAAKGIKDTKRPRAFGAPQPSDGVLSAGDEVLIKFDEEIISGLLLANKQFVTAKGVLNGTELSNSIALDFDGIGNRAIVGDGIQMGNGSFTIEAWVRRNSDQKGTFWSFGETSDNQLKLSFDENGKMHFSDGSNDYTGQLSYGANKWYHIALVYDADGQRLSAYMDDQLDFTTDANIASFPLGRVAFGYDLAANSDFFNGRLRDFRIWNRALSFDLVFSRKSALLSGNEPGLQGYWLMDEKTGDIAQDKSHFRQAHVEANWVIEPSGKCILLGPNDSRLRLDGRNIAIDEETDFSIEFWFKGQGTGNHTLFSSGRGIAEETFNVNRSIAITASGTGVQVSSKGKIFQMTDLNLLDAQWHHLALVVKRRGTAKAFIDGKLVNEADVTGFGGLGSDFFYLGALGWRVGENAYEFDQDFEGAFDEVRFWNSARTADQIAVYKNHRVPVDEVGLVGYYPFEKYERDQFNVLRLNFSLDDQWAGDGISLPGQSPAENGQVSESNETPNIGLERPVKQLNFDLVVNNDEVLIQIDEPLALIENTLLEFSIRDATDIHNNILASPILWTAFVNKNQLKWETAAYDLEMEVGNALSFKAGIRNFGGISQSYFIDNLPGWLSVSPSSGTLNALANTEVTFTINEAINDGDYSHDIYLVADNGVNERLTLTLNVYKKPPDWDLESADYEFSMNAIGLLRIQGELSRNPDDIVAVFWDGVCRGRANLTYLPENDQYMVFLDIYGNQFDIGLPYEIKVWSDSQGEIITGINLIDGAAITDAIVFSPGQLLGRTQNPVIFSADNTLEKSIPLNSGWNWISFNLATPDQAFVSDMFRSIDATSGDLVKSIDLFEEFNDFTGWFGSITAAGGFQNEAMYQLKLSRPDVLVYSGIPLNPAETPITIKTGWNWIGYIPNFTSPVGEALANLQPTVDDLIKGQRGFAIFDEGLGWIGSLKSLHPGAGYKYFSNSIDNRQFLYPSRTLLSNFRSPIDVRTVEVTVDLKPEKFESNMNMVATVTGMKMTDGEYWLVATHEDQIVGAVKPELIDGRNYYFTTLYGQKNKYDLSFKLFNPEDGKEIQLQENVEYQLDRMIGSLKNPFIFNIKEKPEAKIDKTLFTVWPQPFSQSLNIDLELPVKSEVQIKLHNLQGELIDQVYHAYLEKGIHEISFSGRNNKLQQLVPGAYIIMVSINDKVESRILLKQ